MIIATAGHVDHGKTSLLQALTGINADTLPEEKQRGMTIDLGYAYLPLTKGNNLGFIDVPGHEKFLANMLAGVSGVQHALLVIACDDGIMPQTIEHLTILNLLGIQALTVALTKADCVDQQHIDQLTLKVKNQLRTLNYNDINIFATSTVSGLGITELRLHLMNLDFSATGEQQRFRLAIDRAFTVKGSGLVVTGTALSGSISIGDSLWLTGVNKTVRVRGLHAQNSPTTHALVGQRIALNITGDIEKQQINRGDWLLSTLPYQACERVIVALSNTSSFYHWQPVHLHHAARHITGRISLLEEKMADNATRLAELILDKPLYLVEQDIIIIRDISAKQTLGSARVIDIRPPKKGKRRLEHLNYLHSIAEAKSIDAILALRLNNGPLSISQFSWAYQLLSDDIERRLIVQECIIKGDFALSPHYAQQFKTSLLNTLQNYHEQHSDQLGVGRSRLKRMALPTENDELIYLLIEQLIEETKLTNTRGWLHLPEHGLTFSPEQELLWKEVQKFFIGEPLWVREISTKLKLDENKVRQTLCQAAQLGLVVAIIKDRYYLSQQIYQFADIIRSLHEQDLEISAAIFRDQLGIGRKLAIQILEFFDKTGFTRRKGNAHIIKDHHLFLL